MHEDEMAEELEDIWEKRIQDVCLAHVGRYDCLETLESFRCALRNEVARIYEEGGYIVSNTGEPVESFDDVDVIVRIEDKYRIHAVVVPSKKWQKRRKEVWHDKFAARLVKETMQ